jgi:hypothetical protein
MNAPTKPLHAESKSGQRQSFLLRLWSPNAAVARCWQASLEDAHTGERIGFANLEYLFAYLMELTEQVPKHDQK